MSTPTSISRLPFRQIRALYDDETITVYQAYSSTIALPAVTHQRLSASPDFLYQRMTWIKPSWMWMMYRSGYSYKDPKQAHILAIKMKRENFEKLLYMASVNHAAGMKNDEKLKPVRVQWDPERGLELERLSWRSLQVGVGREVVENWVDNLIESIEDVTENARDMKRLIDGGNLEAAAKLLPEEREYPLPEDLQKLLGMDH
ncbi:hypothetical protein RUND412_001027 [Rhizina undulata]